MKASLFNVYSDPVDRHVLVFNTLTLSLVSLDEHEVVALSCAEDPTGNFFALGFLVPDDVDERHRVRSLYADGKARDDVLSVFLVLTLACNFACCYCSNAIGHRFGAPARIAEEGIKFVDVNLRPGQQLFCTFYGGEPLLALPEVERSAACISALCSERVSKVEFDLLTNGYLLNEGVLDQLAACGINGVQISFDLPFAASDRGTKQEDSRSVFSRIVNLAAGAPHSFRYTLRFNLRLGFLEDLRNVVEEIVRCDLFCTIALHHVFSGPLKAATTFNDVRELEAYYNEYRSARSIIIGAGLSEPELPEVTSEPCSAVSGCGYYLTESGVRSCIREVTGPGALIKQGFPNKIARQYYDYDGGGEEACARCTFLPVCNGGCPKDVREGLQVPLRCTPWRFTLKSELNHLLEFTQRRDSDASTATVECSVAQR